MRLGSRLHHGSHTFHYVGMLPGDIGLLGGIYVEVVQLDGRIWIGDADRVIGFCHGALGRRQAVSAAVEAYAWRWCMAPN